MQGYQLSDVLQYVCRQSLLIIAVVHIDAR
jgi:hypothetical protein